jgi:hypothetical protein
MPNASKADIERAKRIFGTMIDAGIVKWLEARGFVLSPGWTWTQKDARPPIEQERFAIQFLVDHWDYGVLT